MFCFVFLWVGDIEADCYLIEFGEYIIVQN